MDSQPGSPVAMNVIAGEEVEGSDGWAVRYSPVDGRPIARFTLSGPEDVRRAVNAARVAQGEWASRTAVERGTIVRSIARLMEVRAEELVGLVVAETGKPRRDAQGELDAAVEMGWFVAGEGRRLYGRTTTSAVPHKSVQLVRVPVGVAGLIVAANTPLPNYAWKVFPALLCGNAVVLKPSEHTPLSATRFVELAHEAGVPSGVLNLVHGHGGVAGAALVEADVDLVSFTGGSEAGRQIAASTGARLVKTCLELGGKNPLLVCDDARLPAAARAAALSAFSNAGQRCASGSRILVMAQVYDEFRELFLKQVDALRVGSGPDDDLGPVISEAQLDRMLSAVAEARRAGSAVLTGGARLGGELAQGCYVPPTVVEQPEQQLAVSCEELFGPIAALYKVDSFDAGVAQSNDSIFGLTAAVWTQSIDRALVFVERVRAGMVVVNGPTYGSEPHMPFGGVKASGNGFREAGTEVLDVYSEWKSVALIHDPTLV